MGIGMVLNNRYELEILHQCGKRVKTKSQMVFGVSFEVCRSCRGKTSRKDFLHAPT